MCEHIILTFSAFGGIS